MKEMKKTNDPPPTKQINKTLKMPLRVMHDRAGEKTGLRQVMADQGLGQDSLKYQRKAKYLIKCDTISLQIFRKKTTAKDGHLATTTTEASI